MPKAFSKREKQAIRTSLMDVGLKYFAAQGIRAVRIDDICRDVGIAKGSFYNFFPSKEDLFMTIANTRDMKHKADMRTYLLEATGTAKQIISGFFDFLIERIEGYPVLKIVKDTGEIAHLMRKVSPQLLAENAQNDRDFMVEVANLLQKRHHLEFANPKTLEGLLTIMLSLAMQAEHIAVGANYKGIVDLMRDLFLSRLIRGPVQ